MYPPENRGSIQNSRKVYVTKSKQCENEKKNSDPMVEIVPLKEFHRILCAFHQSIIVTEAETSSCILWKQKCPSSWIEQVQQTPNWLICSQFRTGRWRSEEDFFQKLVALSYYDAITVYSYNIWKLHLVLGKWHKEFGHWLLFCSISKKPLLLPFCKTYTM